jgi:hypothetical protein
MNLIDDITSLFRDRGSTDTKDAYRDLFRETDYMVTLRVFQDIIGHPHNAPTVDEIDFMNPSTSKDELKNILDRYESDGLLETVDLPDAYSVDGDDSPVDTESLPDTFYTFTDHGWDVLDQFVDTYADEIQQEYQNVRKPDHIKQYEQLPRPRL